MKLWDSFKARLLVMLALWGKLASNGHFV
jgi:hypothetical protein